MGHGHCHCPPRSGRASLAATTEKLRSGAHKLTGPRQAILDVLHHHAHPLTPKEIFAQLPAETCDLATVYRSMHLLVKMKLVQRYDFGDGVARFELLGENDDGHHHHLVCTQCAAIMEIEDCFLAELEKKIAAQTGFVTITHRLEFFGLCPRCQQAA